MALMLYLSLSLILKWKPLITEVSAMSAGKLRFVRAGEPAKVSPEPSVEALL